MNEPALPLEASADGVESSDTPPPTLDAMPQLEQETAGDQRDESFEHPDPSDAHESPRLERERASQIEHAVDDTDGIPLAALGDNTPKLSLRRTTSNESRKSKASKSKSRSPPLTSLPVREPSTSHSTGAIQTIAKTAAPPQQLVVPISAPAVIQGNVMVRKEIDLSRILTKRTFSQPPHTNLSSIRRAITPSSACLYHKRRWSPRCQCKRQWVQEGMWKYSLEKMVNRTVCAESSGRFVPPARCRRRQHQQQRRRWQIHRLLQHSK